LFTDYEALEREREAKAKAAERERKLQKATLALQKKFGKNAVLKGMNLMDGATTIQRNGQVGGHKAE
jgi:DNA polymerase V